jgi:hypothetical protein
MRRLPTVAASKRLFMATSLTVLTVVPITTNALALKPEPNKPDKISSQQVNTVQHWLIADRDDRKDGKERYDDRRYRRHDDDREVGVDLNRAKNLARQAAEAANGGIRLYRAENSMHGPAQLCPYVDNGDSWTFTFTGTRIGLISRTVESVVTVYKNSPRIVVVYNGPVRSVQQTQFISFTSNQRTILIDLLRGNCSCNNLLSNSTRTQIISQSRSLPPGIQRQLLRGKGLPPGIAKKVVLLPKQVNTYINLPTYYDLLVVGSNVVVVDQVRYTVVDFISDVL